jgi:hypothetical protein
MPSRARLDEFIAVVESGDHAGAIERYYTEDATMQENASPPRMGRDVLIAHEQTALARMSKVYSKCVSSVIEGDRVAIHWNFELTENPAWCAASTRSPGRNGAATKFFASASFTTRPRPRAKEARDKAYATRCRIKSSTSSRRVNIASDPSAVRGHSACGRSQ